MKYKIGNVTISLDEIVAIGENQKIGSNYVDIPIYIKGGGKIIARISTKGEDEFVRHGSPYSKKFSERFTMEADEFITAWKNVIE